jgi:hypothetical protein
MQGDFETTDLKALLNVGSFRHQIFPGLNLYQLWLVNRKSLSGLWTIASRVGAAVSAFTLRLFGQNKLNAQLNVVSSSYPRFSVQLKLTLC